MTARSSTFPLRWSPTPITIIVYAFPLLVCDFSTRMEIQTPKERQRAKHTRSKLGCRVCRIRRVKCDGTRPACRKCSTTGRKCEGYPPGRDRPPATQPLLPRRDLAYVLTGNCLDARYLCFFQSQTAPQFAGHFETEFWCRLVLQVATRELCVQQAILALGSLHRAFQEDCVSANRASLCSVSARAKAYNYYTRAIALLNTHIRDQSWAGLDVSLICCILCVAFEWLCGSYRTAAVHLKSGLSVLKQWSEVYGLGIAGGIALSSPTGHLIRIHMVPIFTRLTIQARTFTDGSMPWVGSLGMERLNLRPRAHDPSLTAAREELDILLAEVYLPPQNFTSSFPQPLLSPAARAAFWNRLSQWHTEYQHHLAQAFIASDGEGEDTSTGVGALDKISLLLWYTVLTIMLATAHSNDQMLYDRFLPQFARLVALAECLLSPPSLVPKPLLIPAKTQGEPIHRPDPPLLSPRFSLTIETVPMLYFVATRCRHGATRRKAIALLETCAPREGCWDGAASARLAWEIMRIEEEGLGLDGLGLEEEVRMEDVQAWRRVWKVSDKTDLQRRRIWVRVWRQGEGEGEEDGEIGCVRVLTW